ncbi:MAG: hypothetical protein H0W61_06960 [Bacteroidetes bacterium]|nr:hypothetical protein [Bacteroidota bacterium]
MEKINKSPRLILLFNLTLALLLILVLLSCKKNLPPTCYDAAYYKEHCEDICTQDCPGITGCDGKHYCNECVMHVNGIKKTE